MSRIASLGLNGATIPAADLDTAILAACKAGFSAYEPRFPTLTSWEARHSRALTPGWQGLAWLPLNGVEGLFALGREELASRAKAVFALAARFGITQVILVPGNVAGRPIPTGEARKELTWLKAEAARLGLSLLYEFIGFPAHAFPSLSQAHALADSTGIPLVLDTFHLAVSRTAREDIARLPGEAIGLVHLSDALTIGKAPEELRDEDRVLPGEGGLPLAEILEAIRCTGYQGPISVEVFHPKYKDQDPFLVAKDAFHRATAVLREAGWAAGHDPERS